MSEHATSYKNYWILWIVLLVVTVTMIFIGESDMEHGAPRAMLLLLGSTIKATLIVFYYMHLRSENMGLILTVLVGIFVTGILMFIIPAYDGTHILENRLFR